MSKVKRQTSNEIKEKLSENYFLFSFF